jgi:hypothetical protein
VTQQIVTFTVEAMFELSVGNVALGGRNEKSREVFNEAGN